MPEDVLQRVNGPLRQMNTNRPAYVFRRLLTVDNDIVNVTDDASCPLALVTMPSINFTLATTGSQKKPRVKEKPRDTPY